MTLARLMTVSGEEFSGDSFQAGHITTSPSPSEVADGSEVMYDPFIDLYRRVAGKLSVEWPAPRSIQKTVVRTCLPLYPDCVAELTASWPKPPPPVPGANKFMEFEGVGEAGLVWAPPMEPSYWHCRYPHSSNGPVPYSVFSSTKRHFKWLLQEKIEEGFYRIYFLLPKKSGGFYPILILQQMNKHLSAYSMSSVVVSDWFAV